MIDVLLITGQNSHSWRRSAPFCKELMEAAGAFKVDLTEDAPAALAHPGALAKYQLFFLDYHGEDWGEPAKTNFLAAVRNGAGVTALHAANNSFEGWAEYEKMLGLLWRDREGTSHGDYHEFQVAIVDHFHPITRGLSDFRLWDELYHCLVHPQDVPYRVLAAAYSDPAKGGSGRHEPVALTVQYGKGRVFHCVLGHIWGEVIDPDYKGSTLTTFENEGFQQLLLRGCQWAATGEVAE